MENDIISIMKRHLALYLFAILLGICSILENFKIRKIDIDAGNRPDPQILLVIGIIFIIGGLIGLVLQIREYINSKSD